MYLTDQNSFDLGMVYAFCEMVHRDVKKLALSNILTCENHKITQKNIEQIAAEFNIKHYVEDDFLSTYLAEDELFDDKIVVLFYKDDNVLNTYLKLKKHAQNYKSIENTVLKSQITREFCHLLSYSDTQTQDIIDNALKSNC